MAPLVSAVLVACRVLRLARDTTFSAACLLHRYHYYRQELVDEDTKTIPSSGKQHQKQNENNPNQRLILVCCILLACKTEEEPRRLRDFINLSQMLSWSEVGSSNTSTNRDVQAAPKKHGLFWKQDPPALDEYYWSIKEQIVVTEQHVLRWVAFDVHVSHPHRAVVALLTTTQCQSYSSSTAPATTRQRWQQQRIATTASRYLNQASLYSSQALSFPVLSLAMAALELAAANQGGDTSSSSANLYSIVQGDAVNVQHVRVAKECIQKVLFAEQTALLP